MSARPRAPQESPSLSAMRVRPRALFANLLYASGFWRARPLGPVILFYHGFVTRRREPWLEGDLLRVADFREQLAFFRERRAILSLDEVAEQLTRGQPLDPRTTVLTFDDALASVDAYAVPELVRCHAPFTIAVPTAYPDSGRFLWQHEAACLVHRALEHGRLHEFEREVGARVPHVPPDRAARRATQRSATLAASTSIARFKHTLKNAVPADRRMAFLDALISDFAPDLREWMSMDERFTVMSWSRLRDVSANGGSLAAHGHEHHPHTRDLTPAIRQRELATARELIQVRAGAPCNCFVWPEGATDHASCIEGTRLGYQSFVSSRAATLTGATTRDLPRISGQWPLPQVLWNLATHD